MLKRFAQNKYKLMLLIIGLYLCADVWLHKGQVRVLFPGNFTGEIHTALEPQSKSLLINQDKHWKKGINTRKQINELDTATAGFECDVYFDSAAHTFHVHHDADKNAGFDLDDLLEIYQRRNLQASIWLDVKNLHEFNAGQALETLVAIRARYKLRNKLLVESGHAGLLSNFSDSGFFTAYYVPFFNPYQTDSEIMKQRANSIASVISKSKVNALSGYYFQCSFLNHFFPKYPVLTWVEHRPLSIVNYFFSRKMAANTAVFVELGP